MLVDRLLDGDMAMMDVLDLVDAGDSAHEDDDNDDKDDDSSARRATSKKRKKKL